MLLPCFVRAASGGQEGRNTLSGSLSSNEGDCRLEVDSHQTESDLTIVYRFFNGSSRNAYLFNQLYSGISEDGTYRTARDLVNVEIAGDEVVVSKKQVPIPRHMLVEKPMVPCATRVEMGKGLEERFSLKLPLASCTPYIPKAKGEAGAVVPMRATFELGYFTPPPEGEKLARLVRTAEGRGYVYNPFPIASQKLLRSASFGLLVPVRLSH